MAALGLALSALRRASSADAPSPYDALDSFRELRHGCRSTSGASLSVINYTEGHERLGALGGRRAQPWRAGELLRRRASAAQVVGARALLSRLENCSSVRSCGFHWSFLAILFGAPTGMDFESHARQQVWETLWGAFVDRIAALRGRQLAASGWTGLSPFGGPGERHAPAESGAVLLLSGDSVGFFAEKHVEPFVRQLRCYADRRGMRLVVDGDGQPTRHAILGVSGNHFWAARGQLDALSESHLQTLAADLMSGHTGRAAELAELQDVVSIYFDNPEKQTKVWAISKHLAAADVLVYIDVDVTIRPDSFHLGLVPLLLEEEVRLGRRPSDIYVRDAWPGIECLNSGFVVFRNTRASRRFLELWRQKIWWAVSWDQSSLAETVLEVVGWEVSRLSGGRQGYNSQCLRYLFPIANGLVPYKMYCDCFQAILTDLIGPYRQRRSRIVGFVDPERVDVNYVPSDLFVGHGYDLGKMRLVARPGWPALDPLIVHWAGTGRHRLWAMRQYLAERFNASGAGCPRRPPRPTARALARRGGVEARWGLYGSRARAVRCCEQLRAQGLRRLPGEPQVTRDDMAYWGCCAWRPVTKQECLSLLGVDSREARSGTGMELV